LARRWVKIWVHESLTGTIRFDFTPAERGVWYDLLILAGNCRMDGIIAAGPGKPYPYNWIAGTLNVPLELLESTLEKCRLSERIYENNDGIHILNWHRYQSEYERQKPYRERKRKVTPAAETAMKPSPEETHEANSGIGTETASEAELLRFLETLEGWRFRRAEDLAWLREFRQEYPEFNLVLAKACRDWHSGRAPPRHKGIWKNRFREWVKHERQFEVERRGRGTKGPSTREELRKWKE